MDVTRVRLPRLLDGSLAEIARIRPSELSLSLPLRDVGTAQLTVPRGEATMDIRHWMEIYTARGSAGLYRVTGLGDTSRGEISATLRHAIDTMSDSVWAEQTDYDGTVADFLAQLMSRQKKAWWRLGACQDTAAWRRAGINYTKLSDLLAEVVQEREDYYMAFDFSTTPWTLNFLALPQAVSGELRLGRNVESASITRDDADFCNRLHLSINEAVTEDGVTTNTVRMATFDAPASQVRYGIVERTADIDTADVADPDAWAQAYLNRRSVPAVQISIDGFELATLTGERWDEMDRGRLIRVSLIDMGELLTERVEAVTYPSVIGEPERVQVELANRLPTVSETLARLESETARAGAAARGAARSAASAEQLKEWSLVLTEVEEAVDGTGISQMWQSGIVIDPVAGVTIHSLYQGFRSQYAAINVNSGEISSLVEKTGVNDLEQGATLYSRISQTAEAITAEVTRAQNAEAGLSGSISTVRQTADSVSAEVANARDGEATLSAKLTVLNNAITSEVTDRTNADDSLSSRITQNATEISSKVSAGDIASEINQTAQRVRIAASKINLDGYVTASQLSATNAEIDNLTSGATTATTLRSNALYGDTVNTSGLWVHNGSAYVQATWQSKSVVTGVTLSGERNWVYQTSSGTQHTVTGKIVTDVSTSTIYYLGR